MRLGLKPVTGPLGHSLDMIDGGPDGADIAPEPPFGKQELPHLRELLGRLSPLHASASAPGAHRLDDGDCGLDPGLDVEIGIVQGVGVRGRT